MSWHGGRAWPTPPAVYVAENLCFSVRRTNIADNTGRGGGGDNDDGSTKIVDTKNKNAAVFTASAPTSVQHGKMGWKEIEIPFDSFVLTWRGKVVGKHMEMNKSKITGIGISLLGHDNQPEGPYNLDLEWIKARHASDTPGRPIDHVEEEEEEDKQKQEETTATT